MTSIIYFRDQADIKEYSFSPPLQNWIKEIADGISYFDFDTASDQSMAGYAEQIARDSCLVLLILDTRTLQSPNMLISINNYFLDHRDKCYVLQIRENTLLTRLFSPLKHQFLCSEDENIQKQFIRNVLSPQP